MKLSYDNNIDDSKDLADTGTDSEEDEFLDDGFIGGNDDFFGDGYGMSPMDKHKELLKDLTDFDPVIKDTINGWLGRVWDAEKEKYIKNPYAQAMMNERGAVFYAGFLRTYAKKTNIITNLDEDQSKWIQKDIIEVVFLSLADKMEEFEIKSSSELLILANEIIHSAFLVLFGAEDGKYSKLLSETSTRHENVNFSQPMGGYPGMSNPVMMNHKKKGGFLSNLKKGIFGGG